MQEKGRKASEHKAGLHQGESEGKKSSHRSEALHTCVTEIVRRGGPPLPRGHAGTQAEAAPPPQHLKVAPGSRPPLAGWALPEELADFPGHGLHPHICPAPTAHPPV